MPIVRKLLDASTKGHPTRVTFSPDGAHVAVLGTEKRMTMVALAGGKPKGVSGPAWGPLAFSRDGAFLVVGETTTSLFDATTLKKVWSTKSAAANCAAFSPDGRVLAIGTTNAGVTFHDATTGKQLESSLQHSGMNVRTLSYSDDGATLFSASTLGCVDRHTLADSTRISSPREPWIETIAVAGDRIASGGDTWPSGEHPISGKWPAKMHVTVRSTADLSEVHELVVGDGVETPGGPTGANGRISSVRSVKGSLVALFGRNDGARFVHRWDVADGRPIGQERIELEAFHLDVSPDGVYAAIAARDGVWLMSLPG